MKKMALVSLVALALSIPPSQAAILDSCLEAVTQLAQQTQQIATSPETLARAKKIMSREFDPSKLDGYLMEFWGYHQHPKQTQFHQRPWDKAPLKNISPSDVVGMSPAEFAEIVRISMEIEDPIDSYSKESGHALQTIFPTLGRFMGPNQEELAHIESTITDTKQKRACVGPWCNEEKRHGNYWAQIYKHLTGTEPSRENPNQVQETHPDQVGSQQHFLSRQATEWGASSSYLTLLAHSRGPLRDAILNILRDEIKHLTIFSAAHTYLYGYKPNKRVLDLTKIMLQYSSGHKKNRSGGNKVFSNPILIAKLAGAHLMVENSIRNYTKRLPLRSLREIFETPSKQEALPTLKVLSDDERTSIANTTEQFRLAREKLQYWNPDKAAGALAQEAYEKEHESRISDLIKTQLNSFEGAEVMGSPQEKQTMDQINKATRSPMEQKILRDELRGYQMKKTFEKGLKQIQTKATVSSPDRDAAVGESGKPSQSVP